MPKKFTLEQIGSPAEEISFSKRQMEKPPTRTQKKKGGDNLSHAQLEGIKTFLGTLETYVKSIELKLDRIEETLER